MKRLLFTLVFSCASFSFCHALDGLDRKEILLRMPLLSPKNSEIVTSALESVNGVQKVEACYPVNVMIIGYDSEKIKNESVIMNALKGLEINSPIEKIYSKDIQTIRNNYKITILRNKETQ